MTGARSLETIVRRGEREADARLEAINTRLWTVQGYVNNRLGGWDRLDVQLLASLFERATIQVSFGVHTFASRAAKRSTTIARLKAAHDAVDWSPSGWWHSVPDYVDPSESALMYFEAVKRQSERDQQEGRK